MADMSRGLSGTSMDQVSEIQNTARQMQNSAPFSIATPAVTQINENLSDASFLHPPFSYNQEAIIDAHRTIDHPNHSKAVSSVRTEPNDILPIPADPGNKSDNHPNEGQVRGSNISSSLHEGEPVSAGVQLDDNKAATSITTSSKKKNKTGKKSLKMDTKSKLEKSRQSARECRARKKLRYQYLEDLVCNREKAVVKLREELTMFSQISERMDSGAISEIDRHFLVEQTKENSKSL